MTVVAALVSILIPVFLILFFAALFIGTRTKPIEADDPEAELWMVSHYKLVRFIPAYESASAKMLPELIRQARKDSRRILALPVRRPFLVPGVWSRCRAPVWGHLDGPIYPFVLASDQRPF